MKTSLVKVLRIAGLSLLGLLTAGLFVGIPLAVALQDAAPHSAAEIRRRVDEANQAAAVDVPHNLDGGKRRQANARVFEKVEGGAPLDEAESSEYRLIYQGLLAEARPTLARFDHNLTPVENLEMQRPNNVGSTGIEGIHDHHDFSMRSNLVDLARELAEVKQPGAGSYHKIKHSILAYKDLADVIAHLATVPHTKSTPYLPPAGGMSWVEKKGEQVLMAFKAAQFAPVDSPAYWEALFRALDGYDEMILQVQTELNQTLTPWQRKLVGGFGGWQSLGPITFRSARARRYRPG